MLGYQTDPQQVQSDQLLPKGENKTDHTLIRGTSIKEAIQPSTQDGLEV